MKRIVIVLTAAAIPASAHTAANAPHAGIAAAERAFAADAAERDVWAAFRAAFAPDGLMFLPGPTPAQVWLADRADDNLSLAWAPDVAEAACSGDLGWDAGPAITTIEGQISYGRFFSIWRRDGDGRWRVVADQGLPLEEPVELPTTTATPAGAPDCAQEVIGYDKVASLKSAKQAFTSMAAEAIASAYDEWGAPDLRLYIQSLPVIPTDADSLRGVYRYDPRIRIMRETGGGLSRDQHLAYSYGTTEYRHKGKRMSEKDHWLRVWRLMPQGWRIVAEQIVREEPAER